MCQEEGGMYPVAVTHAISYPPFLGGQSVIDPGIGWPRSEKVEPMG